MIGKTLGHYQITGKLGEGGMGVVYKARDTHLDRFVAIKVLTSEKVADVDRKRRFVQEAKAASALNHPNIITIHDITEESGTDFIVMEYVEGKTLDQRIGRRGLRLNDLLKYAVQIADALARAHSASIVHRDLKPTNIMVNEDGVVKVLDFGLAKLTERAERNEFGTTETLEARTEQGTILGTVAYMSPEQAEGKKVDARSDIFSFGSVLYEMVTGRQAFQGDTKMSTLAALINQEPKPVSGVVPAELERIIQKCLRKDLERRFQHIDDVKSELEDLKEESESGKLSAAEAAPGRKRMTPWAAGIGTLVIAIAAGVAYYLFRDIAPEKAFQVIPLTSDPGLEIHPCFSPEGNQVAYSADADRSNFDIYVKLIGVERPLRLTTDPAADISPAWSPDGRWIAFMRLKRFADPSSEFAGVYATTLLLVPAIGGAEKKLAEGKVTSPLGRMGVAVKPLIAWSPDGRWLAVTEQSRADQPARLDLVSVETGERQALTEPPPEAAAAFGDSTPSFSPDGRTLAFGRNMTFGISYIYRLRLTEGVTRAGTEEKLSAWAEFCTSPAWMADGREILFSCGLRFGGTRHLWRMNPDRPEEARRLDFAGSECDEPAVSRRAPRLVYSRQTEDSSIWAMRKGSSGKFGAAARFIESSYMDMVPRFSPDGTKIVFTSSRSGFMEVWVCESDGRNPQQLTSMKAAITGSPRWSPDGLWITFDANPGGRFALYQIAAGGGAPRRLSSAKADDGVVSWSHDGRQIYFGSNRTGRWEVWRMPAGGGPEVQVTRNGGHAPVESSDGRSLYYHKAAWDSAIWTVPVEGGGESVVVPLASFLNFVVRPEGLYYMTPMDAGGRTTLLLRRTNGKTETLAIIPMRPEAGLEVSPDGKTILYTVYDQQRSDLMLVENFR